MINIVGAGLAGLSAALALAADGVPCRLISAQRSERAQSVLAEGGINAALNTMGEDDDPELHFEDTMKGGCFLADPNAVHALTYGAPDTVRMLAGLGVPFNRNSDGSLMLRNFGGQKKKRTAFAGAVTGKMIMTALIDEVRKYEERGLITRLPHHTFVRLHTDGGSCRGLRIKDEWSAELFDLGGAVIMACGGMNGFFPGTTTGTVTNSGNAAAVLYAEGVSFANLEMIQYHPTTIGIPGKRCLISEAARGEGGRLYAERDGKPWYFMEEKYPELGNLMPRDVVSREMFFVSRRKDTDGKEIWLDMTGIGKDVWKHKLSDLRAEIMEYIPLDPMDDPIPVSPGIHYFMGGIYVNERHETSIPGLYAAGECACIYHGANRLGGNSMLGAVYGGLTAGRNAEKLADRDEGLTGYGGDDVYCALPRPDFVNTVGGLLLDGLGIVRNEDTMKAALGKVRGIECVNAAETARKELAAAMLMSALARKESRGAHYREDFPEASEEYRKTTVSKLKDGAAEITFEDIPERRKV